MNSIGYYAKGLMQVIAAALAAATPPVVSAITDAPLTPEQWVNAGILVLGAVGVYIAPNVPNAEYVKTGISAITAGMVVLASVLSNGVTGAEWVQTVFAVLGALAVQQKSNVTPPEDVSVDSVRARG